MMVPYLEQATLDVNEFMNAFEEPRVRILMA